MRINSYIITILQKFCILSAATFFRSHLITPLIVGSVELWRYGKSSQLVLPVVVSCLPWLMSNLAATHHYDNISSCGTIAFLWCVHVISITKLAADNHRMNTCLMYEHDCVRFQRFKIAMFSFVYNFCI